MAGPVHDNGQTEEEHSRSREPASAVEPATKQQPDDDRGDAADRRDPGCGGRASSAEAGAEITGERVLQHDAGGQRRRQDEDACKAREDGRASGERERERDEAGRPPGLGDRHGVGEMREHPDEQLDPEHCDGATEHERGPPLPGRQGGQGHDGQSGDHDRAAA